MHISFSRSLTLAALTLACLAGPAFAQNPVLKAQADRVELVKKLRPPVVAIFVSVSRQPRDSAR